MDAFGLASATAEVLLVVGKEDNRLGFFDVNGTAIGSVQTLLPNGLTFAEIEGVAVDEANNHIFLADEAALSIHVITVPAPSAIALLGLGALGVVPPSPLSHAGYPLTEPAAAPTRGQRHSMLIALLALSLACQPPSSTAEPRPVAVVRAIAETSPVDHPDDAADDPAIWIHRDDPARSLVLGTNKQSGLCVHDLKGQLLQFLPVGRINNVDVRQGVTAGGERHHRHRRRVAPREASDLPLRDPRNRRWSSRRRAPRLPVPGRRRGALRHLPDPRCGLRFRATVYVNDKSGLIEAWRLDFSLPNAPTATLTRSLKLGSQVEGLVVDDASNILFVGEETVGVWRIDLNQTDPEPSLILAANPHGPLVPDVEGLAIARLSGGRAVLLVSSQGNNTFVALDLSPPHTLRGSFAIGAGDLGAAEEHRRDRGLRLPARPRFPRRRVHRPGRRQRAVPPELQARSVGKRWSPPLGLAP
jgi:3-phytase